MRAPAIIFFVSVLLFSSCFQAGASSLRTNDATLPPFAHTIFCLNYPHDCERSGSSEIPAYSRLRYDELDDTNRRINVRIAPKVKLSKSILDTAWRLNPPAGDCNDYAVTKRHELLRKGWPSSSLLLAQVVLKTGEPHLVLIARMTGIEFVLDNLSFELMPLATVKDEYRWTKITSEENPRFWKLASSFRE